LKAEIVSIGTELLLGDVVNSNASFLGRELAGLGIDLYFITCVGDNPARLEETLEKALSRSDIVITTGGLGPTSDDITREVIARTFEKPLQKDENAETMIRDFFSRRDREMPEENLKQATLPTGAEPLFNETGTAPGFLLEVEGRKIFALPGVPPEMKMMFRNRVRPKLLEEQAGREIIHSRVLRIFGIGESEVENRLREIIASQTNPTVAPLAGKGEVQVRITCKEENRELAAEKIAEVAREISAILGDYIYGEGDDSLEGVMAILLSQGGWTLSVAESCTGGLLGNRITDVPGASEFFLGSIVAYHDEVKKDVLGVSPEILEEHGAVSEETALAMARGAREICKSDIGVGLTGIAGPGGGTPQKPVGTVSFALVGPEREYSTTKLLGSRRKDNKWRAANHALDLVRRYILEIMDD